MIKGGGKALPPGDPDLILGAPPAPPAPLLLMPSSGGPTKRGATAAGQKKIKAERKKAAEAKARDDMIVKARQDAAVKRAIFGRVMAQNGLTPRSAPFGPVLGGTGKGAKPVQSELTANSALAHARALRLLQGGILGPEETRRESNAIKKVGSSREYTYNDKHPKPQAPTLPDSLRGRTVDPALLESAIPLGVHPERTGFFTSQMPKGYYGQGTEHSLDQFTPVNLQQGLTKAFDSIRPDVGKVPDNVYMSAAELKQMMGDAFNAKAYGSGSNPAVSLNEFLTDEQRFGKYNFGTETRKKLTTLMVAHGWNAKDAPNLTDQELAARAFNNREVSLGSMARNFTADLSMLAGLPAFTQMTLEAIVDSVKQRSPQPLLRESGEFTRSTMNMLPGLADRPYSEVVQEHPGGAAITALPFLKFGSRLSGKMLGLKPYRDIELPSARRAQDAAEAEGRPMPDGYSSVRRVSASVHPIARGVQAIEDRILSHAQTPEELGRTAAPEGWRGIPRNLLQVTTTNPLARAGNAIERRHITLDRKQARLQAQLDVGQSPHVALVKYHQALRGIKWFLKGMPGAKEDRQRSIVLHGLLGKDSEYVANYFDQMAQRSADQARAWQYHVDHYRAIEQAERAKGTAAGNYAADDAAYEASQWQQLVDDKLADVPKQRERAQWSRDNPYDPATATPEERALVEAALKVSQEQDKHYVAGQRMNEKGILFGRLQHNMAMALATEGPRFDAHGQAVPGTPLYAEARRILHPETGLRQEHNGLRDLLFEQPAGTEERTPLPASADMRSPEATHQLGRINRLQLLARVADAIGRQREIRREGRRQRAEGAVPTGNQTPARDYALEHMQAFGIEPGLLDRAIRDAEGQLEAVVSGGEEKAARAQSRADTRRGQEAGGHSAGIARKLRGLHVELRAATEEGRPKSERDKIQAQIDELHRQAQEDFRPSDKVLQDESLAEKTRLLHGLRRLPSRTVDSAVDRIIDSHFERDQVEMIGRERLRDAINEALDNAPHFERTETTIRQALDDATHRFMEETGQDPELAMQYQRVSQHYLQRLRAYNQLLLDEGTKTGHLRLMHPEDENTLPPVRVSTGVQFASGNFGNDVHLYLANDLDKLTASRVEGVMYEHLSDLPWVISDATAEGDKPPPGFVAVSREDWQNLQHPAPDRAQVDKMVSGWRSRVPPEVEGAPVFISKELQRQITEAHAAGNYKMSWLLRQTNRYRRWMLYTLPRTLVNNAVGNPIIAMIMGAKTRELREALWTLHNHPERIPNILRGRGPISNALRDGGLPLNGWRAMLRHSNTMAEDNGNLMVYLMHARKAFKKQHGMRWFNRVDRTSQLWHDFLVDAANGKNPDAFEWGKKSAQAFGDMHDHWKSDPTLATSFLFHRWVAHTIYWTLWTLPIHYPGRAAFIWQASNLAEQYQKKHGVYPEWAMGMLRIPGLVHMDELPEGLQKVLWTLGTSGVNPLATPGQTMDLGDTAQPKYLGQSLIGANITPYIRVPVEILTGHRLDTLQPFKNHYGDEFGFGLNWREALNNAVANIPVMNTLTSRQGLSDDSVQLPGFGQWPRYSSSSKYDSSYGAAQTFGHGFWQDTLLRALSASGISIKPLDSDGPRGKRQAYAGLQYQQSQEDTRRRHQSEANVRALKRMHSVSERREWFKKNDPKGFQRRAWLHYGQPGDKP